MLFKGDLFLSFQYMTPKAPDFYLDIISELENIATQIYQDKGHDNSNIICQSMCLLY